MKPKRKGKRKQNRKRKAKRPRAPKADILIPGQYLKEKLSISDRTLTTLLQGVPGVVREAGGRNPKVPLSNILRALYDRARYRRPLLIGDDGEPIDPASQLERMRKAKAVAQERKNALEEGKLMDADEVTGAMLEISRFARLELDAIRAKMSPELAAEFDAVYLRLHERWEERCGKPIENSEHQAAPKEAAGSGLGGAKPSIGEGHRPIGPAVLPGCSQGTEQGSERSQEAGTTAGA